MRGVPLLISSIGVSRRQYLRDVSLVSRPTSHRGYCLLRPGAATNSVCQWSRVYQSLWSSLVQIGTVVGAGQDSLSELGGRGANWVLALSVRSKRHARKPSGGIKVILEMAAPPSLNGWVSADVRSLEGRRRLNCQPSPHTLIQEGQIRRG